MAAELRRVGAGVWVIDLECGIEQRWHGDVTGAGMAVDSDNEDHHRLGELVADEDEALDATSA